MELFATDRDRLAFLLETGAALDLDFEALEVQAEAAAEEPSPKHRPKYITNSIGSKQKLVDWIGKHTPEGVDPGPTPSLVRRSWPTCTRPRACGSWPTIGLPVITNEIGQ
ncbi:MAG: hypothetical protein ACUVRY_08465 [Thermoanaerobaculaceae bacterium]